MTNDVTFLAHMCRRRFLHRGGMLCVAAGVAISASLGACAIVAAPFIPDSYTFSKQQVQAALAKKLPYHYSKAGLFNLELSNPVVELLPETNRVRVRLDVSLSSLFIRQLINNTLTVSSQLEYDSASRSIMLIQPRVDDSEISGVADEDRPQIELASRVIATQWLDHYPIYTFKPEQLECAGVQVEPGTITILTNGIRVQIIEK